jgi:hypothetical protein
MGRVVVYPIMTKPGSVDQRSEPRASRDARARVFYGPDLGRWWDGGMRDLSPSGMKLEIPGAVPLPNHLTVLDIGGGQVFEVRVKWRRGDMLGGKVRARHTLDGELKPPLDKLKAVWQALN